MSKLRIGIIGAGHIAQRVYIPEFNRAREASVSALCDIDRKKAQRVASEWQISHCFERATDLISSPALDVVVICTPNSSHAEITTLALQADKHVICEKPLAVTAQEAKEVVELAYQRNKSLLVGFTNRFRPDVQLLRSIIQDGDLGCIYHVKVGWLRRRGVPGIGSWFTAKSLAGGGALMDLGSHLLDLVLWLLSPLPLIEAIVFGFAHSVFLSEPGVDAKWYGQAAQSRGLIPDVEDTVFATIVLDNRVTVSLEVAWVTHGARADRTYVTVFGTEGAADLSTLFGLSTEGVRPSRPLTLYRGQDRKPTCIRVPGAGEPLLPYQRQVAFFAEQLCQSTAYLDMARTGAQTAALVDAIYTAHEKRESVSVDLALFPLISLLGGPRQASPDSVAISDRSTAL